MDKKTGRLLAYVSVAAVAVVVVVVSFLLLQQPLPASTVNKNPGTSPGTNNPGSPTSSPSSGGTSPTSPPSTAPPPENNGKGKGNGHLVPKGWDNANCADASQKAHAYGLKARCGMQDTFGELKKLGLAGSVEGPSLVGNVLTRTSDPGNSGAHRSDNSRPWSI